MDKVQKLEKFFPQYFELFTMPEGAGAEEITVYRACKTWKCDKESFTPTFEENGLKYLDGDDPSDPGVYSLSTFEKAKDVKRFVMTSENHPKPHKIAIGVTNPECGIVQRTKDRKGKKYKSSHMDWWLYEGAEPQKYFSIIENFEEYLEEQKQAKGGIIV